MVFEYYHPHPSSQLLRITNATVVVASAAGGRSHHHHHGWMELFHVVPVICFGYQCHVSVIPIYSCMKKRNKLNFTVASFSGTYILVGSFNLVRFVTDGE